MQKVEYKKYKMALDMVLWKIKFGLRTIPGAVFKDFVSAGLVVKLKQADDERAAAQVLPAPRGGLFGYFAPV